MPSVGQQAASSHAEAGGFFHGGGQTVSRIQIFKANKVATNNIANYARRMGASGLFDPNFKIFNPGSCQQAQVAVGLSRKLNSAHQLLIRLRE